MAQTNRKFGLVVGVVIGILMVGGGDGGRSCLLICFGGATVFYGGQGDEPGHLPFLPNIGTAREQLGIIQRANGQIDSIARGIVVEQ